MLHTTVPTYSMTESVSNHPEYHRNKLLNKKKKKQFAKATIYLSKRKILK